MESDPDAIACQYRARVGAAWRLPPDSCVRCYQAGIARRARIDSKQRPGLRLDRKPADDAAAKKPDSPTERAMHTDSVTITHPHRIVFPQLKLSKQDVADYYRAVAAWILPGIADRPLSLVRCPGGIGKTCFFQKHLAKGAGDHVHGVTIAEKNGVDRYLYIDDAQGLLELVQLNVLEFHPWGARVTDPEHADRIVFDLDPHASVAWARVQAAAESLREQLASIHLESFVRTSGGKGLHVVVPLQPGASWDEVRDFAQSVAEALVALEPKEFVSVAGEKNRKGRIFIDWLRNGRGATSIASYSLRASESAGVAMPLAWADLKRIKSADAINVQNAIDWITKRGKDPWAAMHGMVQKLPRF